MKHVCIDTGFWVLDTEGGSVRMEQVGKSLSHPQLDMHYCPFCGDKLETSNKGLGVVYYKGYKQGLKDAGNV